MYNLYTLKKLSATTSQTFQIKSTKISNKYMLIY
uniref:Uncharacterized protein n=1 Tax=Anguilla anguilla TaxID=7936 RepID=A0A0E9UUH8_ANGAN